MQLFILAPIILIPLYKWRQKFIGVFLVLIITSAAYNFVYILQKEVHIMSAIETTLNVGNQTFFTLYRGLLARASTWLIGALLAYWIHTFKKDEYRLPCIYVLGGWLSTATLIATVVFTPYGSQEIKLDVNFLDNAFYGALARLAWGLAVAWIIFACSHGYGGFVNSFLSYPMWGVLARLTYSIYIIHVPTQFLLFAIQRFNGLLGNFISIQRLWSDFGVILTVGVLAVLTLEYPVMALEKALLGRPRREPINNGPIIHAYGTNMQQLQNHERIDTTD